jgi:hypothetical protein
MKEDVFTSKEIPRVVNGRQMDRYFPEIIQLQWKKSVAKQRPKKEAGFLWSVYHQAVAVSSWKAQISLDINSACDYYPYNYSIYIFYEYSKSRYY